MFGWALRVSRVIVLLAAAVIGGICPATSAAAQVPDQAPAVSPYTLTPERIAASGAAVVGLIGAVIGGVALARSAGHVGAGNGRRGAIGALVMGPIALISEGWSWPPPTVVSARAMGSPGGSWPWSWGCSAAPSAGAVARSRRIA